MSRITLSGKSSVLFFLIFFLLILSTATSYVHAQNVSVHGPNAPLHALPGRDLRVTVTVDYSKGLTGYALVVLIWDSSTNYVVAGSVYSTPDTCSSLAGTKYSTDAACLLYPKSNFVSESLTFILRFDVQKTYQLAANAIILDSSSKVISGTTTKQDFTVSVSDRLFLDIQTQYPAVVTVDGSPNSPGTVSTSLSPGSHSISVPSIVPIDDSTRLRFDHWSDGSTLTNRTINLQDDTTLTAVYNRQYRLSLVSSPATATGQDWYDSGSKATFSAPSRFLVWAFQGWYEDGTLVSASNNGSVWMHAPHTLTARWTLDYPFIGIIFSIIALVVLSLLYCRSRTGTSGKPKRRRTRKGVKRTQTAAEPTLAQGTENSESISDVKATATLKANSTTMFCNQCGATIPRASKFCKECGTKLVE